jgi:hypothetical protein
VNSPGFIGSVAVICIGRRHRIPSPWFGRLASQEDMWLAFDGLFGYARFGLALAGARAGMG